MSRMHFNSSDASSIPAATSILCNFSGEFVAPPFAQHTIIYLNLHVCFFHLTCEHINLHYHFDAIE